MAAIPKPLTAFKNIDVYPDGHAVKDPEYLSKSENEQAVFSTKTSKADVEVVFDPADGTPFNDVPTFVVPAGTNHQSGALRGDVVVGKHYHYTVRRPGKGTGSSADPEIIITP